MNARGPQGRVLRLLGAVRQRRRTTLLRLVPASASRSEGRIPDRRPRRDAPAPLGAWNAASCSSPTRSLWPHDGGRERCVRSGTAEGPRAPMRRDARCAAPLDCWPGLASVCRAIAARRNCPQVASGSCRSPSPARCADRGRKSCCHDRACRRLDAEPALPPACGSEARATPAHTASALATILVTAAPRPGGGQTPPPTCMAVLDGGRVLQVGAPTRCMTTRLQPVRFASFLEPRQSD